ncbi:hypothetical protein HA402_007967 [Bradysia odoriphaga]|nr:hypothetical protein HA402_007967 [Bradysia odoriphaga]
MATRKQAAADELENNVPAKMWKVNPPGPEQKELNRMFQQGLISISDTPAKVRSRYPMFNSFAPKTFALHFRTTKARYGLNAVATTSNVIPELAGIEEDSEPRPSSVCLSDTQLEARHYPHMVWTFKDHSEQKDIVCVAVPIVAGSRDIKFVISDDGNQVTIDYVWPASLLDPTELFYDVNDEEGDAISMSHAMVYSYKVKMDELDMSEKSRPGATFVVNLPLRVQRELGTFKKHSLKCGESRVVMLQMTAYQKKRVMIDADTSFKF